MQITTVIYQIDYDTFMYLQITEHKQLCSRLHFLKLRSKYTRKHEYALKSATESSTTRRIPLGTVEVEKQSDSCYSRMSNHVPLWRRKKKKERRSISRSSFFWYICGAMWVSSRASQVLDTPFIARVRGEETWKITALDRTPWTG